MSVPARFLGGLVSMLGFLMSFGTMQNEAKAQEREQIVSGNGTIDLSLGPVPSKEFHDLVIDWVKRAAKAVTVYYGQYPVHQVSIEIDFDDEEGVHSGRAFGWNGAQISIVVGRSTTAAEFRDDWTMTHEMVHLAFPSVPRSHHWIEEGLATYVEPVARVRSGDLTPERIWGDMFDSMDQGLPKAGDRGLDFTHTWGRTYWGGALFCLLADIEIRKRTGNRRGLEDAMRGILKAGGSIEVEWPLEKVLKIADDAVGVPVLEELYEKMRAQPMAPDLQQLWKDLGVRREGNRTVFDETAPLASIRRGIDGAVQPTAK